jgi:hypothetical protein
MDDRWIGLDTKRAYRIEMPTRAASLGRTTAESGDDSLSEIILQQAQDDIMLNGRAAVNVAARVQRTVADG